MNNLEIHTQELNKNGFTIVDSIFSPEELQRILRTIQQVDSSKSTFRKTKDLFAIRQFLKEVPGVTTQLFSTKLKELIQAFSGIDYFVVKSIYFDKPEQSNWFVAYHQDLTISVNTKAAMEDYGPWTVKQDQFAVQPPLPILQNILTLRIHLDDTDESNGALKVIPGSHKKGIYRPETIDWQKEKEVFCEVKAGSVMLMKPLLLHASNKTTNQQKRRVIHLELSSIELPSEINWAEKLLLFS